MKTGDTAKDLKTGLTGEIVRIKTHTCKELYLEENIENSNKIKQYDYAVIQKGHIVSMPYIKDIEILK